MLKRGDFGESKAGKGAETITRVMATAIERLTEPHVQLFECDQGNENMLTWFCVVDCGTIYLLPRYFVA